MPKYRVFGEIFSAPTEVVGPPVPDKDSVTVGFPAFEVKETLPVTAPFAVGLKLSCMGALLPGATVSGNWPAGTENRGLSTEAAETIRFPPLLGPVFDT